MAAFRRSAGETEEWTRSTRTRRSRRRQRRSGRRVGSERGRPEGKETGAAISGSINGAGEGRGKGDPAGGAHRLVHAMCFLGSTARLMGTAQSPHLPASTAPPPLALPSTAPPPASALHRAAAAAVLHRATADAAVLHHAAAGTVLHRAAAAAAALHRAFQIFSFQTLLKNFGQTETKTEFAGGPTCQWASGADRAGPRRGDNDVFCHESCVPHVYLVAHV
uniref:Uncharacterized protein n=1 Tax=Oryza sativa subsp. japonica TaxID=39947 RepID=Q75H26_ORYSJ|nr:hypothetical protein [Oryza sativa Japonica Group]